jgi:hypothetical protein
LLQLILFFEDLRSERRFMEAAADRLSLRWYVGYDLHELLPDHSSLSPGSGSATASGASGKIHAFGGVTAHALAT